MKQEPVLLWTHHQKERYYTAHLQFMEDIQMEPALHSVSYVIVDQPCLGIMAQVSVSLQQNGVCLHLLAQVLLELLFSIKIF